MELLTFMRDAVLLLDGGTGTLLQAAGLKSGESPETWVLTHPDEIRAMHLAYYTAGSHVVCTDTFGANLLHHDRRTLEKIIPGAVRLAVPRLGPAPVYQRTLSDTLRSAPCAL